MQFRRELLVAIAIVTVVAVAVQGAAAQSLVPFSTAVHETATHGPCSAPPGQPPNDVFLCATALGVGQATHLGTITEVAHIVTDLSAPFPTPNCHPEWRTSTFTAANGDEITVAATGQQCVTGTTRVAHDTYTVTGGTGRFSGATGYGTDTAVVDLANPNVSIATTTFSGLLSSPGSLH